MKYVILTVALTGKRVIFNTAQIAAIAELSEDEMATGQSPKKCYLETANGEDWFVSESFDTIKWWLDHVEST